jgi:hypothetical protein
MVDVPADRDGSQREYGTFAGPLSLYFWVAGILFIVLYAVFWALVVVSLL